MSSRSAALALKAAAVAALLAVLVLPSLGARCPSTTLGAELARAAAPPPPPPGVKCDCSYCIPRCEATVAKKCSQYCGASSCDDCKSREMNKCKGSCKAGGSCNACAKDASTACGGICFGSACADCKRGSSNQCTDDCNVQCHVGCGSRL